MLERTLLPGRRVANNVAYASDGIASEAVLHLSNTNTITGAIKPNSAH
jgi:hypothetical protein